MHTRSKRMATRVLNLSLLALLLLSLPTAAADQFGAPKGDEGTRIFKATEHPYYSGQFHLSGQKATLIGSVNDRGPWDHLDYAGKHLKSVQGSIDIQVNELTNSGQVVAEFVEGSDRYRIVFERFAGKAPFRMAASRLEFMNMGIRTTAIRCIQKRGSILEGGAPPPCTRTIKCSIRITMPTSWSWNGPATPKPMRFTIRSSERRPEGKLIQLEWKSISGSGRKNKTPTTFHPLKLLSTSVGMK